MLSEDRREQLKKTVLGLRRKRGTAALDGSRNLARITAELGEAEAELNALEDAEVEQMRRAGEAAEDARRLARERLRSRLVESEAQRLKAIAQAEEAARQLALHLSEALAAAGEVQKACASLGAHPLQLSGREFENRLSGRLSSLLDSVKNRAALQKFGRLGLWTLPGAKPEDDWAARERSELSLTIEQLTEGTP